MMTRGRRRFLLEPPTLLGSNRVSGVRGGTGRSVLVTLKPKYKFWLETEDGYVFGEGPFALLQGIQEKGTITASAKDLRMSYRHAWGIIKQMEENLGQAVLVTYKGGKDGGGGAELTPIGQKLLATYLQLVNAMDHTLSDFELT